MPLHDQKLEQIMELVNSQPYWTSIQLARKLDISRSTIQKCLQELHNAGLVERLHGGVRRKGPQFSTPVGVDERLGEDTKAKESICALALSIAPAQGYVYIDAGTTTLPLAKKLEGSDSKLMIVTNDLAIASSLAKSKIPHALLGGQVHPVTRSISGPVSQAQLSDYIFEACFISVDSISADGKVCSALHDESLLKRQAIAQSRKKILLAASSKFVKASGSLVCRLDDFDVWITDKSTPAMVKVCKDKNIKLICAK